MNNTESVIKTEGGGVYFAAANSERGFFSFYGRIFDGREIVKKYIIKGGPGTGKSGFMKRIGALAEAVGREVEYYLCSSDPESVDGIVIDRRVAMMDGTAPHTVNAELVGARDELVDLLAFCDVSRLESRADEIRELSEKKRACYAAAYERLGLAGNILRTREKLVGDRVARGKLERSTARVTSMIPRGDGYGERVALLSAFGMKGRARVDSFESEARRVYELCDRYGVARIYLNELIARARENGQRIKVSYSYLFPDRPDGVLFEESGDCFLTSVSDESRVNKKINMQRFLVGAELRESERSEYRELGNMASSAERMAEDALRRAGEYHFALESIYVPCMDFKSQNEYARELFKKMTGYFH